ncbi:MAG: hypothetical protein ACRDIB_04585, partial [Ardenticatenaceae bacterium]
MLPRGGSRATYIARRKPVCVYGSPTAEGFLFDVIRDAPSVNASRITHHGEKRSCIMSRRGRAPKREVTPDPRYGSDLAGKFINKLMLDGKKSLAQSIFYDALDTASDRLGQPP